MNKLTTLLLWFVTSSGTAQSLPIDFETAVVTADFVNFDGGVASVIPNPHSSGINTSATVASIVRNGGTIWAGSKIALDNNLDFTSLNSISMKVFTTAPVGTIIKFKLEGAGTPIRLKVEDSDDPVTSIGPSLLPMRILRGLKCMICKESVYS